MVRHAPTVAPKQSPHGFQTVAIHGRVDEGACNDRPGESERAVARGIELSTTFRWPSVESGADLVAAVEPSEFYRRLGGVNVRALEDRVAEMEGAERALAVASGMAANVVALMAALPQGGHVVCARTVYGEVSSFLRTLGPRMGITATFADGPSVAAYERALRPDTRAIFVECPANPTLDMIDLEAVSALAIARGAVTIVDATLATPFNCRPLELGCDVVTHSATKYFAGHCDAMGGLLAGRAAFIEAAWHVVRVTGAVLSPFDAWLIDRGLRTLGLRMERHNTNAERVAAFLAGHPAVARVAYPSLPTHPAFGWARTQHRGFGGVLSVEVRGGASAARDFVGKLTLFTLATSLGGVESLVQFPASMARLNEIERMRLGISPGLVRLSVGCEDGNDLLSDLAHALPEHADSPGE